VFGLAVDDVDFLRDVVHVQRQVKIVGNRLLFAAPKGRKSRDVPLPDSVANELSAHLRTHPAVTVTLPWESPTGPPRAVALILTSRERGAMNRNYWNHHLSKPALEKAGRPDSRENGMHALRHWYASVLLHGGESIKALSEYLGHSDSGFTLRTYTHLMPASEERTRRLVDVAFVATADGPMTAQGTA